MKVTVCFGEIRVIVPCQNPSMTVKDLVDKASSRYKKVTGKSSSHIVNVAHLENDSDGGIYLLDDEVADVIEDRERLVAVFEEGYLDSSSSYIHNGHHHRHNTSDYVSRTSNDTGSKSKDASSVDSFYSSHVVDSSFDSWNGKHQDSHQKSYGSLPPAGGHHHHKQQQEEEVEQAPKPFKRNGNLYQSMGKSQLDHDDAEDEYSRKIITRAIYDDRNSTPPPPPPVPKTSHSRPKSPSVRSPSRASASPQYYSHHIIEDSGRAAEEVPESAWFYPHSQDVNLLNDGSPLGIEVNKYVDNKLRTFVGLLVERIHPGSRAQVAQLFYCGDVIVEINGNLLMNFTYEESKMIFDESAHSVEVQFRVLPVEEKERFMSQHFVPNHKRSRSKVLNDTSSVLSSPLTSPSRIDSTTASSIMDSPRSAPLVAKQTFDNVSHFTRKIGNCMNITLTKGSSGLGFSVTSRDTVVGDPCPIYIKNILPRGAAVLDGRLQAGDRLLEVNGTSMTGFTQQEAVNVLREIPSGTEVQLIVSRQKNNGRKIVSF